MEKISLEDLKALTCIIHDLEGWQEQNPRAKIFYHLDTKQVSIEYSLPNDFKKISQIEFNPAKSVNK